MDCFSFFSQTVKSSAKNSLTSENDTSMRSELLNECLHNFCTKKKFSINYDDRSHNKFLSFLSFDKKTLTSFSSWASSLCSSSTLDAILDQI